MKLGPVTKRDNRKTSTSKKFVDKVMSANCDVIAFFPIYGQFAAILKPIPEAWSIKRKFSLIVTFYITEPENRTKNPLTQLLISAQPIEKFE